MDIRVNGDSNLNDLDIHSRSQGYGNLELEIHSVVKLYSGVKLHQMSMLV